MIRTLTTAMLLVTPMVYLTIANTTWECVAAIVTALVCAYAAVERIEQGRRP